MNDQTPAEVIFFGALDKASAAERTAYLDEACAGNEALRRRVAALLAAHPRVGQFLERPVAEAEGVAAMGGVETDAPELSLLAPPAEPGSLGRLDHYEVLEVVGKGGMGVVLRARDTKLHRVVAIKVLAAPLAVSGPARQRFTREARAAAAVRDDHVVAIHAVEDQGPVPYLVMEFIDGCNLEALVRRGGPLEVKEILRIGMQAASGLAAAHKQGLIHRDVKPANILLENGVQRVKLTDFGLARAADDASLTQSGVIAGTPAYMSPEQASGEVVDHRSDLFSLGSVLYTLCAGHPPFRASTTMAVLKRVCEETPRPLREVNGDVPEWLAAVIARLHAKAPAERFQTAAEVAELLGRHLAHLQQPGIATPEPRTQRSGVSGPPKSTYSAALRARLGLLAALIAVGCVSAYGILWWPDAVKTPDGTSREQERPENEPWKPRSPLTPEELARLPSPLDGLKRDAMDVPHFAPPEVLASLGETPRFRLDPHSSRGWMAQTGDGRLLAVPDSTRIRIFDTATGALVQTLHGAVEVGRRTVFSPDGKWVAAGNGVQVWVWNVATGEALVSPGPAEFWAVAFDRDNKRVVSADAAGTIHLGVQAERFRNFPGHAKGITQIAFNPDHTRLATASLDGTCKVWDPGNWKDVPWKEVRTLKGNGFEAVAWSPDGKRLAAGDDAEVVVWDADTFEVLHTLKTPGKGLLAFSPDGRTLFTAPHDYRAGEPHEFTRWDVKTGDRQKTFRLVTRGRTAFFHLSPDGRTVYLAEHNSPKNHLRAIDTETGLPRFPPDGHAGPVPCVAWSPDGRTLASGGTDRLVCLWDLAGWQAGQPQPPFRVLAGHGDAVGSLAFSPDGSLLATAGDADGSLFVWETATGRRVHDLSIHAHRRSLVAFTPDGTALAVGGEGRVHLWDVRTGKKREPLGWNEGPVRALAFSPDGRLLAASDPQAIQVIDWKGEALARTIRTGTPFTHLTISSDSKTLAAISDGSPDLRMWDLTTGQEQAARASPRVPVLDLAFHPGGRLAATTSRNWVHLWDATPGSQEVRTFDFKFGNNTQGVAFSPEGRFMAVGMENGTIALVRVTP